jgi:hypothetical protein
MKLGFSTQFSKEAQISSFIKIRLVGAELFHADRQVPFRNSANAPDKPGNVPTA